MMILFGSALIVTHLSTENSGRDDDRIVQAGEIEFSFVVLVLPNPEPYILNALAYLEKRSTIVMYVQTSHAASHVLNLLLDDALPEDRAPNHKITSRTLTDILDKNNISYEGASLPGTFGNVTDVIKVPQRALDEI
ncbi:MAG: hypothetical protein ACXV5I_07775 [Halobacteriota archaeon]